MMRKGCEDRVLIRCPRCGRAIQVYIIPGNVALPEPGSVHCPDCSFSLTREARRAFRRYQRDFLKTMVRRKLEEASEE